MTTVTVEDGDTLWGLAETHLGDPLRWREIFYLNRNAIRVAQRPYGKQGPDWIFAGTVLTLPN